MSTCCDPDWTPSHEEIVGVAMNKLIFDARSLRLDDLPKVDSHLHTAWTDGEGSVRDVYSRAVSAGLSAILFSEHSRKTSIDWFGTFAAEVRALPKVPCVAYVGTECKVESPAGDIDTVPDIADACDFVMASVHRFPDNKGAAIPFDAVKPDDAPEVEFQLSMAALENPAIHILGHPFGMSLRRYKVIPPEDLVRKLVAKAAKCGVAVEINSHYHNNPWQLLDFCREYGALVTFGSNAHSLDAVGQIVSILAKEMHA